VEGGGGLNSPNPAPYPVDTRAKGWRLELDYEKIDQSDTWGLAAAKVFEGLPLARPLLLAMWYAAWKQTPCGSLPADETLIAAAIGIPKEIFAEYRDVLMRGWWLADDGRLYHNTLSTRVLEMVEYRKSTAERVAKHKAAKREQRESNTLPQREPTVKNSTGTGTGSKEESNTHTESISARDSQTTPAGRVCRLMLSAGLASTNPSHPDLLALIDAGASDDEFREAARTAVGKGKDFAYTLGIVKGQRKEAAEMAKGLHRGPMPQAPPSRKERQLTTAALMTGATPKATPKASHDDIDIDARIIENTPPRLGQAPVV
jgi:hypothetical protein